MELARHAAKTMNTESATMIWFKDSWDNNFSQACVDNGIIKWSQKNN
jgi:hypothetical protein